MIVADANLVAYMLFSSINTALAQQCRKRDRLWIAPELIRFELYSVVTHKVRRRELTRDKAIQVHARAMKTVRLMPLQNARQLFIEAERTDCSAYDLTYVALAL